MTEADLAAMSDAATDATRRASTAAHDGAGGASDVDAARAGLDPSAPIRVRKARAGDVPAIFATIGYWASQNKMLVRPMPAIFENLRDYFVAEIDTPEGPRFAGNGALHVLWGDIAEVRGLAVDPEVSAAGVTGVGRALVAACEDEARAVGIPQLFAWTYAVGFFEKCGFSLIDKSRELHPRVWSECLRCPFFVGCNENGMLKRLEGVPMPTNLPEPPPTQIPPGIG